MDAERQRLINEAARIANDIDQHFMDARYWNHYHPNEKPLDPDPDGQMVKWKQSLESMLKSEAAHGNHPSVVPLKAHPRRYVPIRLTDSARKAIRDGLPRN